ncbi:MAG: hypothetical protein R2698_02760 [Microthrixaceae bacterium]
MGFSNGGMMVYRFLCSAADRVAAAASVSGTNDAGCEPNGAVSILHIHGTADESVPYRGGASVFSALMGSTFPPVEEAVGATAAAQGCGNEPTVSTLGAVTDRSWTNCRGGARCGWSASGVGRISGRCEVR